MATTTNNNATLDQIMIRFISAILLYCISISAPATGECDKD
jgi:hypothetical protein